MPEFEIKDSGERAQFESGMVRDTEAGKLDYTLILDGPMLERWAAHMTKGAEKYASRNWMQATGPEELERFKRSLLRHTLAYLRGETDEDHAAAMIFNINGMEYVSDRLRSLRRGPISEPGAVYEYDPRNIPEGTSLADFFNSKESDGFR